MSNKIELKLSSSVNEYEFSWNEEYVGTIIVNNKEAAIFVVGLIDMTEHLNQPEFLRALADTLESLNKKV